MATSIDLKNISKAYQPGKRVLEPVNLSIRPGELFFLLGPSGCGKSTLLRILAGLVEPDSGEIYFNHVRIDQLPPEKRQAAMVFQNYALFPHLSVYENVAFGLKAAGKTRSEIPSLVAEALKIVQLEELGERAIPSLSGGQQQRVALARSLVVKPAVLLLDEPLSNLDARLRDSMRLEIRRICKERNQTAIYVTHDRKEALSMADRIAVLHQGVLQQIGTPLEVYRKPRNRFVASFLGDSNFISAVAGKSQFGKLTLHSPLGVLAAAVPGHLEIPEGKSFEFLIRPECISDATAGDQNSFEAEVTETVFLGECGGVILRLSDGTTLSMSELAPGERRCGQKKYFKVKPEDIVCLEPGR